MQKLPINTQVEVIKSIVPTDPRIGQKGVVQGYSAHDMICVSFPDEPKGIYFNSQSLKDV